MQPVQINITYLSFDDITNPQTLKNHIYPDMSKNYYWTDNFTPHYYIAQAKAGFISVTEIFDNELFLIPEIQYSYALLDFKDLHISKKVKKLLKKKNLKLEISSNLWLAYNGVNTLHKNSWLKKEYIETLEAVNSLDANCKAISVVLKENGEIIAGELGYIIGNTYTSLSGFSSREKKYRNYGTAQLVLLAQYLEESGFDFINLGQPYMDYKLALGAKIYQRQDFLVRWFNSI